tara:strand:- start:425 stop:667 length:243 start_codon:yes stop_codon:yes gene_type:complete
MFSKEDTDLLPLSSMKTKKKFVNVEPISEKARFRFITEMNYFHACEVKEEKDDMYFVCSLNKQYYMWLPKKGNEHWKVVK